VKSIAKRLLRLKVFSELGYPSQLTRAGNPDLKSQRAKVKTIFGILCFEFWVFGLSGLCYRHWLGDAERPGGGTKNDFRWCVGRKITSPLRGWLEIYIIILMQTANPSRPTSPWL
jgi:hypothetical protein